MQKTINCLIYEKYLCCVKLLRLKSCNGCKFKSKIETKKLETGVTCKITHKKNKHTIEVVN